MRGVVWRGQGGETESEKHAKYISLHTVHKKGDNKGASGRERERINSFQSTLNTKARSMDTIRHQVLILGPVQCYLFFFFFLLGVGFVCLLLLLFWGVHLL